MTSGLSDPAGERTVPVSPTAAADTKPVLSVRGLSKHSAPARHGSVVASTSSMPYLSTCAPKSSWAWSVRMVRARAR